MLKRFCDGIDRVNEWMGWFWGLTVIAVTIAVIYEVIARTTFGKPTLWSNEFTIYLSAMTYLIAGGYALRHHVAVRVDEYHRRRQVVCILVGALVIGDIRLRIASRRRARSAVPRLCQAVG